MSDSLFSELSLLEIRVLGVLVEKQHTVPDTYPLTLNAVMIGCNQKSSRDPVIEASQRDVQDAVDRLKHLSFVSEVSGGRVVRYMHHVEKVLQIPMPSAALLAILMLRGPQTAGELRINSERLHRFADISSVESFLVELTERSAGGLVTELPRQPGARENRWMHLLSGTPKIEIDRRAEAGSIRYMEQAEADSEIAGLKAEVTRLGIEVSELRRLVNKLCQRCNVMDA